MSSSEVRIEIPEGACCSDLRMSAAAASEGLRLAIEMAKFCPAAHQPGPLSAALHQIELHSKLLLEASGAKIVRIETD